MSHRGAQKVILELERQLELMLQRPGDTEHPDRSWNHRETDTHESKVWVGTGIMARTGSKEIAATERRSARKGWNYGDPVYARYKIKTQEKRQ